MRFPAEDLTRFDDLLTRFVDAAVVECIFDTSSEDELVFVSPRLPVTNWSRRFGNFRGAPFIKVVRLVSGWSVQKKKMR